MSANPHKLTNYFQREHPAQNTTGLWDTILSTPVTNDNISKTEYCCYEMHLRGPVYWQIFVHWIFCLHEIAWCFIKSRLPPVEHLDFWSTSTVVETVEERHENYWVHMSKININLYHKKYIVYQIASHSLCICVSLYWFVNNQTKHNKYIMKLDLLLLLLFIVGL